ncbi:hypothetical protein OXX69_005044 [Metschnikowia pulcherrima]
MFRRSVSLVLAITRKKRLTTASRPTQELHNSVLDTSQLEIVKDLRAEQDRSRIINLDTRIRLSHFLRAVFLGDYATAIADLENFRSRCTRKANLEKNVQIYTSSFVTLLTQACRPNKQKPSASHVDAIVSAAANIPKSVPESHHIKEIKSLSIILLLRELNAIPPKSKRKSMKLITSIRCSKAWREISSLDVLGRISAQYPHLISQYNQVFQTNEMRPNSGNEDYFGLKNALEAIKKQDGQLSFDSLCKFIETCSFDASAYTDGKAAKYYEISDTLSGEQKQEFMESYLKFNYKKQLLVEEASQNVYKSMSDSGKMIGFNSLHKRWVYQWLKDATEELKKALRPGAYLEKFAFVFDVLPPRNVCSLVLTHLLSATVPTMHAKVFPLATKMSRALRWELSHTDNFSTSSEFSHLVFNNDHSVEFVCSIADILMKASKIPEFQQFEFQNDEDWKDNVFRLTHVKDENTNSKFARHGAIEAHPIICQHFKIYEELFQTGSYNLPMLHPPRQWTSPHDGGFYSIPLPLMKSSEPSTSNAYMKKAHETGQLASVYQSVNALGMCAWTINQFTLEAFNKILKTSHLPGLPTTLRPKIESTPKPEPEKFPDEEAYRRAYYSWKQNEAENLKKEKGAHSSRIYYDMVNRLANSFAKNGEVLYLPHNMDFRGRVYPAVSFLSHQNEDLVRSLMIFWDAKPLGETGYDWLVYQLANLYNKSKTTMEQSKSFVEAHRSSIIGSAQDPLAENAWWLKADNPWQVLALCHEFDAIWRYPHDIASYRSRIPVHQDGSCNGLQHYSALGADDKAARAVNVLPGDTMQDVYSTVLGLVEDRVSNDIESKPENEREFARLAQSFLSRKLIKQTVMTTVYGVTPYGATQQVKKRIEEMTENVSENSLSGAEKLRLAGYISGHVLESISDLFAGAELIQNWLVDCCSRCIQAYDPRDFPEPDKIDFFGKMHYRPMMWTSLSGFPVIQMYRKRAIRELRTPLQKLILRDDSRLAPIDELKSKNGIAPNFIHSIDAIHLLMTCLSANSEGLTFAAVHDSFWTHASEVGRLSEIIRKEFARLHSSDIIASLQQDMAHVNRNSFQLVWVNDEKNTEFVAELNMLREKTVGKGPISGQSRLNEVLRSEIHENSQVNALVETYKPQLLWVSRSAGPPIIYDDCALSKTASEKVSPKTHVPLLVPVKLRRAPEVGTLDIQAVLQSKYFFS